MGAGMNLHRERVSALAKLSQWLAAGIESMFLGSSRVGHRKFR